MLKSIHQAETGSAAALAVVESLVEQWALLNGKPQQTADGDFNDGFAQGQRSAYGYVVLRLREALAIARSATP